MEAVEVTFSEEIDLPAFDYQDVVLTRNEGPNLVDAAVTVSHVSGFTYRIGNLARLTQEDGNYRLTVDAAGIRDFGGNAGANSLAAEWALGLNGPVIVSLEPVSRPRNTAPAQLTVTFSGDMQPSSLDHQDVQLLWDGEPVSLDERLFFEEITPASYRPRGLDAFTAQEGQYRLTILAAGTLDSQGRPGWGR